MEDGKIMNNLNILYEDNHIIVVIKPSNILSQKDITNDLDMLTIIKNYIKEKYDKKGNVYLGLVHRLDRMTSGIMVFAKTSKAAKRLSDDIKNNKFYKEYLCIVKGKLNNKGKLENYLAKDEKLNKSFITDKEHGKYALLEYSVVEYNKLKNMSLLKIKLHTGRHHQIRVQLSNINHPLIGDIKYNNNEAKKIYLHAYKLSFYHPTKKELLTFENYPNSELWNIFKELS